MPSTIRLHRVFKAPPQRIYKAFLDPAAMAKVKSLGDTSP